MGEASCHLLLSLPADCKHLGSHSRPSLRLCGGGMSPVRCLHTACAWNPLNALYGGVRGGRCPLCSDAFEKHPSTHVPHTHMHSMVGLFNDLAQPKGWHGDTAEPWSGHVSLPGRRHDTFSVQDIPSSLEAAECGPHHQKNASSLPFRVSWQ
jgi:hypothetical protein